MKVRLHDRYLLLWQARNACHIIHIRFDGARIAGGWLQTGYTIKAQNQELCTGYLKFALEYGHKRRTEDEFVLGSAPDKRE
jgi:hypothetical protein